ncbi:DNA repair protein RecN [Permianibacter sp. IMCC34836]|uniref:DNA repair protein RecN n=1 Tax=Permianibacter fluminis TaxID=2738515 RepID=UPI001553F7BE|nr:DNA repair protein RecN [Permianibacter fluminis]NQD35448.1 DNA repair protein RecN [Permianibacter fluminis]
MLTTLALRDFAIVTRLQLEWADGMTVLTGETGAGKSILIDALGIVLGDRADAAVVRHGAEQAEVLAGFAVAGNRVALAWLAEQAMEHDGEVLLRRVISKDGKSRAFINGTPVTLTMLRELGGSLVEIHGQHEHQRLLHSSAQRDMLDEFAGHDSERKAVREAWQSWQKLRDEYQQLKTAAADRGARLDLLQFQTQELAAARVEGLDIADLEQQHKRAAHASEMAQLALQAAELLEGEDGEAAADRLEAALERLLRIAHIDNRQQATHDSLLDLLSQLRDLAADVRRYGEHIEIDEQQFAELDAQLVTLHQLARKHRCEMVELPELYQKLQQELDSLTHSSERLDQMEQAIAKARASYIASAEKLSTGRQKAAQKMAKAISATLEQLNMKGGKFEVALLPRDETEWAIDGREKIDFLVSANAGQPPRPLNKVASGGELSRISLAIQVLISQKSQLSCMIFDEVDVGIGGATAEIVGRLLRQLGDKAQVLCVTHQAQVAALGHHHYRVQKASDGKSTSTEVVTLSAKDRIEEIARMVGGTTITDTTRKHAKEMLAVATGA